MKHLKQKKWNIYPALHFLPFIHESPVLQETLIPGFHERNDLLCFPFSLVSALLGSTFIS
ncbi:MAG: hypothetical protein ACO1O1_07940 [Adhaeribacter sp.]